MSEQEVAEQTQTVPQESAETQTQQQEAQVDTSKIFSKGYNEGKLKAEKDALAKLRSLGIENAENLDDVVASLGNVLKPKQEQESEVTQLRKMLEEANKKAEDAQLEYEAFVQENRLNASLDSAMSALTAEGTLTLKGEHLKNLFFAEYDIDFRDGQMIPVKDGSPLLDKEGNYKGIESALKDFVRTNKYLTPKVMGTGGGTGDGATSEKPSKAEFQKLLRDKSADSQAKAAALWNASKTHGWA